VWSEAAGTKAGKSSGNALTELRFSAIAELGPRLESVNFVNRSDAASDEPCIAATRAARPDVAAYALALLTLVSFFNYLDRMVLAVVLQPIKRDLALSDSELGLISGVAFALFYASFGLPLARLADRTSRVRILGSTLVTAVSKP
jgi:hypothetical protein